MLEESSSPALDADRIEIPSPKEENNSTNSEAATDTEDFEISDDDDDDRNHKHRKREAKPQSDDNAEEQHPGISIKKRSRVSGNGQPFGGAGSQGEARKDFVPKFKRRPGAGAHSRAPRVNQSFRANSSASASARPPRGRGRNGAPWTQHDPRFNTHDMMDFASQMAPQGPPAHPGLFMGAALPNGPYGFMPGMPHGILDPIHPLGMQGPIQPAVSPLIDLGMPRQRCRDFEERGFCLRGDMCPMEHGVNRIVVDDMQSLSQFNLPVSVPNTQGLGIQNEGGTGSVNSSSLGGSKSVPAKDVKSCVAGDAVKLNGSTTSAVADADVYDPDQPLWNNEHPEVSCAGFVHNDAGMWNPESSGYEMGQEHSNQVFATDGSQSLKSSVWGRTASKRKSKIASTSMTGNKKSDHDEMAPSTAQSKPAATAKDNNGQSNSRIYGDVGRQSNRAAHKASRTLYVHGIPQESNRWEALLSHFQKFGQVIDIYIPSNSEKAFVQFSKREEAEAALKAPDAVMGNRFIRLWWANRDRIPDEGEGRIPAKSSQLSTALANSAPQPSYPNRVKENIQSTTPRPSSGSSAEPLSSSTGSKMLSAGSIKPVPHAPKRNESLELLEELRKKQEILAQKRDEFRRQLEKLAKQKGSANSVKHAEASGKEVASNDASKVKDAMSMNARSEGSQEVAGSLEKQSSGELASCSQKSAAISTQKSAVVTKLTTLLAPPQNRFKLDNRTTSFRILPPLPSEIANESILADHFSSFGELSSVVLEDTEAHNHDATLKPSLSCSACVTYTTRQSAEKAFIGGKSCKGHTLRFMWLTASPGSNNHSRTHSTSIPGGASSPVGKTSSTATSCMAAVPHNKSISTAESAKISPVGISKASGSTSSLSSNDECPPEHGSTRNVISDSTLPQ
ncbi:unnamed protein product [Urochloa humidicola]